MGSSLADLRRFIDANYNADELRTLCYDLGVDFGDLPPGGKTDKARELVAHCMRHGRLGELIELGWEARPDVPWPSRAEVTRGW